MGFWGTLYKMLGADEEPVKGFPPPARPAPPMPTIKAPKNGISEPVLSIIRTLKNGEWSYKVYCRMSLCSITFTHEWYGNNIRIYVYGYDRDYSCGEEWMTKEEQVAVADVCWQIYQGRVKWEKEQSLAKERESFMCLTKEK